MGSYSYKNLRTKSRGYNIQEVMEKPLMGNWMSVSEASRFFGISRQAVYIRIMKGTLIALFDKTKNKLIVKCEM